MENEPKNTYVFYDDTILHNSYLKLIFNSEILEQVAGGDF
jgi:hypothetical protein